MLEKTIKASKNRFYFFLPTLAIFFLIFVLSEKASAQELHNDLQGVWRAEVLEVLDQETILIPGTDTETFTQTLEIKILEGERSGETLIIENDRILLKEGNKFFLNYLTTIDGRDIFSVREVDRRGTILFFTALFVATIIIFGRWQGLRALISLAGTFLVIIYVLLPLLLKGYPPVLVSSVISAIVLFIVIYFTHGFNRESTVAFAGTVTAVIFTSILAFLAVQFTQLTGFASDEAIYLNFSTYGQLDFTGLLLGGIIIGALGVLDDIAITQSAVTSELWGANQNLSKKQVYKKAMRVGREHAGSLVNTLALAYAGASLPLLLLFSTSEADLMYIINQEVFSTEIIRTIVGSIGLVLTIPITTLMAVFILHKYRGQKSSHSGHSHSHTH